MLFFLCVLTLFLKVKHMAWFCLYMHHMKCSSLKSIYYILHIIVHFISGSFIPDRSLSLLIVAVYLVCLRIICHNTNTQV
jgi:hypothetical protein